MFYLDTETYPIRPHLLAPKLVAAGFVRDEGEPTILLRDDFKPVVERALREDVCCAHNGAFDWAVIAAAFPDLVTLIFRAHSDGRIRDTMIRAYLSSIAAGTLDLDRKRKGSFTLESLASKHGFRLQKGTDSWRLRYALLDGVPPEDWPTEAKTYLLEDVGALRAVDRATAAYPDEWFQCCSAFSLYLAAAWGVSIDQEALEWVATALMTRIEESSKRLEDKGLLAGGKVSQNAIRLLVEEACAASGLSVPKTPTGKTKIDGETIASVADRHPVLSEYVALGASRKNLSTYIEPMRAAGHRQMCSRPNVLVSSGRLSWGGFDLADANPWWAPGDEGEDHRVGSNLTNFPQEAGVRDCIRARPGSILSSTDYSALELRTFAQCVLWTVGHSTHADGFRKDPDWDPHSYFGGRLVGKSYEEALTLHRSGDPTFKPVRQVAKNCNFALIGGVGAARLQQMLHEVGIEKSLGECYTYKRAWFDAFPEVPDFFRYIEYLVSNGLPFRQFVSGRIRGDVTYTSGANTGFQGLGGDIAKYAFYLCSQECYAMPRSVLFGSRPLILVHDEIVAEHPSAIAHEANMRIVTLMNQAFEAFCPDVPSRCEPTLTSHYTKSAKPRYEEGRLVLDKQVWDL